jgi:hypothetical protein
MKKIFNLAITIFILFPTLQSCKKNKVEIPTSKPTDVYVAGYEVNSNFGDGQATYWKNGEKIYLPTVSSSVATSIFVMDDSVYVAGRDGEGLVYWKNKTKVKLTVGGEANAAGGIFVAGKDVYMCGSIRESSPSTRSRACYWKNGTKYFLGEAGKLSEANTILVNGNDLYVTGVQHGPGGFAGYWKNGVPVDLTTSEYQAIVVSIFIIGNDLYLSGFITKDNRDRAAYWKNNVLVSLHDGTLNSNSYANSIYVKDDVVYVAGREDNLDIGGIAPVYWVNGVKKYLTLPTGPGEEASSIFVSGKDVYVTGRGNMIPVIWKNGERTELPHSEMSAANAVFVK